MVLVSEFDRFTRRRALAATGTALATGLAGCTNPFAEEDPFIPDENEGHDRRQDDGVSEVEPHQVVHFRHTDEDDGDDFSFSYNELVLTELGRAPRGTTVLEEAFDLTLHDDLSTVTLDFEVATAVELTVFLYIPTASAQLDGPYSTENLLIETVAPTTEPEEWNDDNLDFEPVPIEFDLPGELPEQIATELYAHLLVTEYFEDVPEDEDADMGLYLTHRPTMAVPYEDSEGSHTHVFDDFKGVGYEGNDDDPQFLWQTYPDSEERTLYFTIHSHGVRWGGAVNIPHGRWTEYKEAFDIYSDIVNRNASYDSRSEYANPSGRVYNVDHHPYVGQLAQTLWDAHTKAGITSLHDRLTATARFVQHLPYEEPFRQHLHPYYAPIQTLWRVRGNCTDKTYLYNAILRSAPYNIRTAYISTEIRQLGAHRVTGIDVRDLERVDDSWRTVRPSRSDINEGVPDTEYVFLDTTHVVDIGQYNNDVYQNTRFGDTTERHLFPKAREYGK